MRSSLIVLSSVLCFAFSARADLLVVQKVIEKQRTEIITLKLKGAWLRVDRATPESPISSAIYDKKSGDMVLLLHGEEKGFFRFPTALTEKMKKQVADFQASGAGKAAPSAANDSKPRPTGKTERVQGFETEEYIVDNPEGPVIYAVAKNFPHWSELVSDLEAMLFTAGQNAYSPREFMPAFKLLPGWPVRVQSRMAILGEPVSVVVDQVKEVTIPESDFAIPAGYKDDGATLDPSVKP